MSRHIVLFLFLGCTFLWHQLVPRKWRDFVMPWAFAGIIGNICCSTFYGGGMHAMLGLLNYAFYIICVDGFAFSQRNQNPCWKLFVTLWCYMIFSTIYGKYTIDGIFYWVNTFLTSFCCGYFVALWVLRTEDGLKKLLFPLVVVSCITVFLYYRHGGITQLEVGANRGVFNEDTMEEDITFNQNAAAIYMMILLSFLTVAIVKVVRSRSERIVKLVAMGAAVMTFLIMVRQGSRGGAICLLPIMLYFMFPSTFKRNAMKRNAIIALLAVASLFGVKYVMKGADVVRAFAIKGDTTGTYSYDTAFDQITTGRYSMWKVNLKSMTDAQIFFGGGLKSKSTLDQRVSAGNAHCMYMTVLYNSGIIGVFLLLCCLWKFFIEARKMGDRGRLALLFIGMWALHGVGESWGMTGGGTAILAGLGIGLLSRCEIWNSELEIAGPNPFAMSGYWRDVDA